MRSPPENADVPDPERIEDTEQFSHLEPSDQGPPLEAIRQYVGYGIPVFPVHYPKADGACSCKLGSKCENIGKHPMSYNGVDDATLDLTELVPVWDKFPEASIGLATGHTMEVLDLDNDDQAIKLLEDEVGMFADEDPPMVQTGRGHHVWYQPIGGTNRASVVPGVDWRGLGGYLLAPPSLHANGRRYEWHGGPFGSMPKVPAKLQDLILRKGDWATSRPQSATASSNASIVDRLDVGPWNPNGLIRDLEAQAEGNRNAFLFWAASTLLEEQTEFEITDHEINEAMTRLAVAALDSGLGHSEIEQTISSAERRLSDGIQNA